MDNVDLRLLKLFDEIYTQRSVSKASRRLGLTQPAVSIALSKLRKRFGDPLFVTTPRGMEPTTQAVAMIDTIRQAVAVLEAITHFKYSFDPATSQRLFRLAMTDVGQITVLPSLLNRLKAVAPALRVEVTNIDDHTTALLEAGEADLVLGFLPQLQERFFQQSMFEEHFVCLARKGHPRVREQLTREHFERELHVHVTSSGTGHLIVDKNLDRLGVKREVAVRIPNFLGLATVIGHTDYLCTLPARAGEVMARSGEVVCWPCPVDIERYRVCMHWHERQSHDPGNAWMREMVRNAL